MVQFLSIYLLISHLPGHGIELFNQLWGINFTCEQLLLLLQGANVSLPHRKHVCHNLWCICKI